MGSVVERDGQLGFELVIDLTASRVEAVEAMRPRDGSLLHGAPVDLRMSWPRRLTVVPTRCDQYGPSLPGAFFLRGVKLACAVRTTFAVDGTSALRDDGSRHHLNHWIKVSSPGT